MTPDRKQMKGDLYMIVQKRSAKGSDEDFTDKKFVLDKKSFNSKQPQQRSSKCIAKKLCYRVVVYSKSGTGMVGKGSFDAYWNGMLYQ